MKILANDGISEEGKIALQNAGYTVVTDKVEQVDLAKAVNEDNYEIVLVRSATTVRKEVIDACPGLKLIGRGGVGMDNIDVAYARENGRTVINTPASSSQSVAELVMGQLFSLSRFLPDSFKNMETGDFNALKKNYAKGIELRGKTLGIIGFGRIGQSLASYALAIGMEVIAVGKNEEECEVELAEIPGFGTPKVKVQVITDLEFLLANADYISIHVPKQADGSAVIAAAEFAKMKKGVRIANAARGGVVNEDDLLVAL
ncbi:MAG: 3-phosphoglycerate dehydrogenase, partial [Crocinitomicaceae bacterium]|nr:3-phosphoglycerate dehydrogenase [Crocinitomicaceae bacterium]